jgi:hypothetical protein
MPDCHTGTMGGAGIYSVTNYTEGRSLGSREHPVSETILPGSTISLKTALKQYL